MFFFSKYYTSKDLWIFQLFLLFLKVIYNSNFPTPKTSVYIYYNNDNILLYNIYIKFSKK